MHIIPTLLTTTKAEFCAQMSLFQQYFDRIQLDIADGQLVPNITTRLSEIYDLVQHGDVVIQNNIIFDFHLMVEDYYNALDEIQKLKNIGMHVNLALINARHRFDHTSLASKYDFSIGLDIFPEENLSFVERHYNLSNITHIQVMTVSPGFQGSPFLPEMLDKIQQLWEVGYGSEILIDGGVNEDTIPLIRSKKNTPDCLCIGSYLTKAGVQFEARIDSLRKIDTSIKE